jgi:glycogen(starch) synthase
MTGAPRPVSVVINTYNRAPSLRVTLEALEYLDYPVFEVIVVDGPSTDDTQEVLRAYEGKIKTARCANRNLAESRNIGVALAAGDVVAFIDDDAYPDPAWLDALAAAYDDPEVAGAGGPIYDFTGWKFQAWMSFVNRLGASSFIWGPHDDIVPYLSAPSSNVVPHTIGVNSSFRRDHLVAVGGFDEEYEYYLEESDMCRRLVDAGYVVRPLEEGFVYHKILPSHIREQREITRDYRSVLKNKVYFSLRHGPAGLSFAEISEGVGEFIRDRRTEVHEHGRTGALSPADVAKFEIDRSEAPNAGLEAFASGAPRTRDAAWFAERRTPLVAFPVKRAVDTKLHICFLSQEYPPDRVGGIGRVVHHLATGLAGDGHVVRVLTSGRSHETVDFEEGVWVHRLPVTAHDGPGAGAAAVPQGLWDHAATMRDEIERIHAQRPVDIVEAPNWDAEGIAVLLDGRFRVVVSLHTPVKTVMRVDPVFGAGAGDGDDVLAQMVELDRYQYTRADGIMANSEAIVSEIERTYGIELRRDRLGLVPHGLADLAASPAPSLPPTSADASVRVLFVGRLEARKGVDTLLAAVPRLLEEFPQVTFTLAGDDSLPVDGAATARQAFEAAAPDAAGRVEFTGPVDDDRLLALYAGCDVFVAPSRFESFGLVLLEAMMFGKPVVATDIGGIPEIVEDGVSGVLVAPADVDALADALRTLVGSAPRRAAMGAAARARYEECFTRDAMVEAAYSYYRRLIDAHPRPPAPALRSPYTVKFGT